MNGGALSIIHRFYSCGWLTVSVPPFIVAVAESKPRRKSMRFWRGDGATLWKTAANHNRILHDLLQQLTLNWRLYTLFSDFPVPYQYFFSSISGNDYSFVIEAVVSKVFHTLSVLLCFWFGQNKAVQNENVSKLKVTILNIKLTRVTNLLSCWSSDQSLFL